MTTQQSSFSSTAQLSRKANRSRRNEWLLAGLLLAPNLILLAIFTYRPLLDNFRLSFFSWNISSPNSYFVGLDNYIEYFSRDDTWTILLNTVLFTFFAVVGSMILGLLSATVEK